MVHPTSVTNTVDHPVTAAGLVDRRPNPADGRGVLAADHPEGRGGGRGRHRRPDGDRLRPCRPGRRRPHECLRRAAPGAPRRRRLPGLNRGPPLRRATSQDAPTIGGRTAATHAGPWSGFRSLIPDGRRPDRRRPARWQARYDAARKRDADFTTLSGMRGRAGLRPDGRRTPGSSGSAGRASSRSPAGSTPPGTAGGRGRSASSPASATRSRRTSATR